MKRMLIIITVLVFTLVMAINSLRGLKNLYLSIIEMSNEGKEGFYFAIFFVIWIITSILLALVYCSRTKWDSNIGFSVFLCSFLFPLLGFALIFYGCNFLRSYIHVNINILCSGVLVLIVLIIIWFVKLKFHTFYEGFFTIPFLWLYMSGIVFLMNQYLLWLSQEMVLLISIGILIGLGITGLKKPRKSITSSPTS